MMNSEETLALYEAVSQITDQMLAAARQGDWDRLIALEEHCSHHVQTLQSGEPPEPMTGASRDRKVQIIHKILADDREIRDLAEPWMAQLAQMINSTRIERKVSNAYRGG
jgi:flagellar protein FliT